MKKKFRTAAALIMILAVSAAAVPSVSAAEESDYATIQPRYSYINSASVSLTDNEDDTANFSVVCTGTPGVTQIEMDVVLQKKGVLGIYSKVDSASKTVNKAAGSYHGTFDIDSSETYRIKYTYTVHTSNDSESDTMYSDPT